jgi:hypothetical protein
MMVKEDTEMHLQNLELAPSVNDYLKAPESEETAREFQVVVAGNLLLTPGGLLQVGDQTHELMDEARKDLPRLARIPVSYFNEIDAELRAVNFNSRLPHFLGRDEALEVVISNDNAVHRVQRPRFGQLQASRAVEALLGGVPGVSVSNDLTESDHDTK